MERQICASPASAHVKCNSSGLGGLVNLRVLLGPVHGAKPLHVLLDVLLGLVLHILVTLKVLGVVAGFQLLIHDSVSKLEEWAETKKELDMFLVTRRQ